MTKTTREIKMNDFNLSEKICCMCPYCEKNDLSACKIKDVKEFIRRLKDEFSFRHDLYIWQVNDFIDKLAGEKLTT